MACVLIRIDYYNNLNDSMVIEERIEVILFSLLKNNIIKLNIVFLTIKENNLSLQYIICTVYLNEQEFIHILYRCGNVFNKMGLWGSTDIFENPFIISYRHEKCCS